MRSISGRPAPCLVMVAGPNGSGKSTLIAKLRHALPNGVPQIYINADDLQRQQSLDVREAQRQAQHLRDEAIARGQDLMFETVMSHPSKVAVLQRARYQGFRVVVHLVATQDAEINVRRVALRVAAGGHDVPPDKTRARYHRTLHLSPAALSLADEAYLWDNTHFMSLQAVWMGGQASAVVDAMAPWVQKLVSALQDRDATVRRLAHQAASSDATLVMADLEHGSTLGAMMEATPSYLLQEDAVHRRHVLHDTALWTGPIPAGAIRLRTSYLHGVLATEILPSTETLQVNPADAGFKPQRQP